MNIVLMHAPLDDPTLPYHSTAYLAGHLAHNGFKHAAMRDINVEFVNYCLEPKTILEFHRQAEEEMRRLQQKNALSFEEQEQLYCLSMARRPPVDELTKVAGGFRDRQAFEDYPRYVRTVNRVVEYFAFLGNLAYPSEIVGFTLRNKGRYSTFNVSDLLNLELGERICRPLENFFWDRLANDRQLAAADLLGISIIYDHQLVYALHFARLLKRRWPGKQIVLGGTSISQYYKHLRDKSLLGRLFCLCDAIVIGEGETAICEIADSDGDLAGRTGLTNTATFDAKRNRLHIPPIKYENVAALGRPIYDHPWDLYLSPERGINYSPTRGCYWNRCTFCDYGLNSDSPTSPWRERKIDQVISDLQYAREKHGVKYVYFAVDVMAPGYLERLSDAMVASKLDIKWSAELRLEKIFSAERCRKMASSGCVCVSFGMESGNQRILDLIDKGTKVAFMGQTMQNFSQAAIAVQLMAFTDFPTETPEEKLEAGETKSYWLSAGAQLLKLDKLVYRLLQYASMSSIGFGDLLAAVPAALRPRVQQYILDLEPKGFISFTRDGRRLHRPHADARIVYKGGAAQRPYLKLQQAPSRSEWRTSQPESSPELVQISVS